MADFPFITSDAFSAGVVSTADGLAMMNATVVGSAAWPSANLAIFVPIRTPTRIVATKLAVGSGTATGNLDIGIYNAAGARLVSTGTQAKTSNAPIVVDIADTAFGPGLFYLAMAVDGTTNVYSGTSTGASPIPAQRHRLYGVLEAASSFPLPATVTFAASTATRFPVVAAYLLGY